MITLLNLGLSIIYRIYVEYITGCLSPHWYAGYIILETLWSAIQSWYVIYEMDKKNEERKTYLKKNCVK